MPAAAQAVPSDLPQLASRGRETSKHDYGRVVIVGGATGMAGAPALAGMAAAKSGAGLVEVLVPDAVVTITAGFDPCLMTRGLPSGPDGTFATTAEPLLEERLATATVVAIGPGMGRSAAVAAIVAALWRDLPQPAVFDADALWAIAQMAPVKRAHHAGPRVLTPHVGEMLRLLGHDPSSPRSCDRAWLEAAAVEMAAAIDAIVVLKGPGTLVTDGTRSARNETGNPGMATGGTGDVLTGMIAALLGQGLSPFDAARLAAWIHGRAGDIAAAEIGEISMTARDLLERLPAAFRTR
jgi:ADP-dependent NAD(P)H-hydrate dehydratase